MQLAELEPRLHNFYAPTFELKLDGVDLVRAAYLEIVSVRVDLTLEGAGQFSFVVNNCFDLSKREFKDSADLFNFGAGVEISMGYRDANASEEIISGIVTAVTTSFPASGVPQLTVSGYDHSYCMLKGKRSRGWDQKKDSDVVRLVAAEHNLTARATETRIEYPKIQQTQESDYQLLRKLAERNGFELYLIDHELYFGPPANTESEALTLEWGRGLISFTPELDIADQVTDVEVRGWNVMTRTAIVGKAGQGDEPGRDSGRRSGGEVVRKICKEPVKLNVRAPVFTQQEANRRAEAILKSRSENFIKGSGESIGIPQIRPDMNVELLGIGRRFNRTYYVDQCTHTINSSGYRTSFKVKETTL